MFSQKLVWETCSHLSPESLLEPVNQSAVVSQTRCTQLQASFEARQRAQAHSDLVERGPARTRRFSPSWGLVRSRGYRPPGCALAESNGRGAKVRRGGVRERRRGGQGADRARRRAREDKVRPARHCMRCHGGCAQKRQRRAKPRLGRARVG